MSNNNSTLPMPIHTTCPLALFIWLRPETTVPNGNTQDHQVGLYAMELRNTCGQCFEAAIITTGMPIAMATTPKP